MDLEFIPIDYDYFDHEGRNYMKIVGRTKNKKRVCLIDNCDVSFYGILKPKTSERTIKKLIEQIGVIIKSMM